MTPKPDFSWMKAEPKYRAIARQQYVQNVDGAKFSVEYIEKQLVVARDALVKANEALAQFDIENQE